jgi:hypothetical protein
LKPAQANSLEDPILKKNPSQKRAGTVAQGIGPEFKLQYCKKKKRKKKNVNLCSKDIEANSFSEPKLFPFKKLNVHRCGSPASIIIWKHNPFLVKQQLIHKTSFHPRSVIYKPQVQFHSLQNTH